MGKGGRKFCNKMYTRLIFPSSSRPTSKCFLTQERDDVGNTSFFINAHYVDTSALIRPFVLPHKHLLFLPTTFSRLGKSLVGERKMFDVAEDCIFL